ncbi:MAG TPA: hypothetical protein VNI01_03325 [Elusimicrobiota bacterium]|nr:hypothetical protein [Elusimicrobiota bacterium]
MPGNAVLVVVLAVFALGARAGEPPAPDQPAAAPAQPPDPAPGPPDKPAQPAAAPENAPPPPPAPLPEQPRRQDDGRQWRQITAPSPPPSPDSSTCNPARGVTFGCDAVDPANPPGQGGYYYGLIPGPDGKLRYGKLYVPQYGESPAPPHNDPPDSAQPRTIPDARRDSPSP